MNADLRIAHDEVHVWHASLLCAPAELQRFQELLSDDELSRAARFHFDCHRRRFIASRGLLRSLLGRYMSTPPEELVFRYARFGKPALCGAAPLRFNLSHCGDAMLLAISKDRELGVDIERIDCGLNVLALAETVFSKLELATLRAIPPAQRAKVFFNGWTRKEAFVKANGAGLSIPLSAFDVSMLPDQPAALLQTRWERAEAARWSLQALEAPNGFAAALAVKGKLGRLRVFRMRSDFGFQDESFETNLQQEQLSG